MHDKTIWIQLHRRFRVGRKGNRTNKSNDKQQTFNVTYQSERYKIKVGRKLNVERRATVTRKKKKQKKSSNSNGEAEKLILKCDFCAHNCVTFGWKMKINLFNCNILLSFWLSIILLSTVDTILFFWLRFYSSSSSYFPYASVLLRLFFRRWVKRSVINHDIASVCVYVIQVSTEVKLKW